jgi:hypothetical protein
LVEVVGIWRGVVLLLVEEGTVVAGKTVERVVLLRTKREPLTRPDSETSCEQRARGVRGVVCGMGFYECMRRGLDRWGRVKARIKSRHEVGSVQEVNSRDVEDGPQHPADP